MQPVLIFGAGGLGQLVRETLRQAGEFEAVGFCDSEPRLTGRVVDGVPVLGGWDAALAAQRRGVRHAVVAVGFPPERVELAEQLAASGFELISAIHPLATIAPSARIGPHVLIGPRVTICVHAEIGAHCIISAGSIVEHDNRLGVAAFLHPAVRLAGGVSVGDYATLGIGSCVIPGRSVGAHAHVAPGAVVIRNVPESGRVAGAPAVEVTPETRFAPSSRGVWQTAESALA